jgi:hypothetical protein
MMTESCSIFKYIEAEAAEAAVIEAAVIKAAVVLQCKKV